MINFFERIRIRCNVKCKEFLDCVLLFVIVVSDVRVIYEDIVDVKLLGLELLWLIKYRYWVGVFVFYVFLKDFFFKVKWKVEVFILKYNFLIMREKFKFWSKCN